MAIQNVRQRLAFLLTDKTGKQIENFIDLCDPQVLLPPFPQSGQSIEVIAGGRSYRCTVTSTDTTYSIDANHNIEYFFHIQCAEVP